MTLIYIIFSQLNVSFSNDVESIDSNMFNMQTETQNRPFNLGRANVLTKLAPRSGKGKTRNHMASAFTKQSILKPQNGIKSMPSTKIKDVQFKYYKYRRMLRKLRLEEMPKNLNKDDMGQFK